MLLLHTLLLQPQEAEGPAPSPPPHPLPPGLVVDGVDLSTLGLVVEDELTGWRDAVLGTAPMRSVPGRGLVAIGAPTPGSRRLGVHGWIRLSRAEADVDALMLLLSRDTLTLGLSSQPGRVYHGRATEVVLEPKPPVFASGVLDARLVFECADPLAYETVPQTVDFGAATPLPLGTAPVRPVITLAGVTNPVLIYRDGAGVERGRLMLSGAFAAADPLVVDCAAMTLRLASGANQAAALMSGDFLTFDPRHASGATAPTLEVTPLPSGTGAIARAEYTRSYRSL